MSSKQIPAKRAMPVQKQLLQCIGYITPCNNPDVITSVLVQDPNTGIKFSASVFEALNLASEGKLVVPPSSMSENNPT